MFSSRLTLSCQGHILHDRKTSSGGSSLKHTYHVLFSPRRSELAVQLLATITSPPILTHLNLYDLGLELVPLEHDVLSLEEEKSWADIWSSGDHAVIHRAAMALMTIQHIYGAFPRIVGKGDMAKRLCSLITRQRREYLASDPSNPNLQSASQSIDSIIILDRSVDLATPLCTQLTYEGLIDEVVGIHSAHVEVDQALVSEGGRAKNGTASGSSTPLVTTPRKAKKVRLDQANDPLFGSVRDENFAVVGERLHISAKQLNEDYEKRHTARTVAEMRAFVSKLGGLTKAHSSLRLHTGLTEQIMEYTTQEIFNASLELQQNIIAGFDLSEQVSGIEDLVINEAPRLMVLRLLCLLSVAGGGIKPKNLEFIKREILQTYGYQNIRLINKLEKTGLLTKATPSSARANVGFQAARSALRLVVDEVDERMPNDISYVYSGYAPLSIRLVQAIAQKDALLSRRPDPSKPRHGPLPKAHPILGWTGFEDILGQLPGASFDETQTRIESHDLSQQRSDSRRNYQPSDPPAPPDNTSPTTTLVFFLGGVTFSEISALRFMSRQTRNRRFVTATTNILSGDKMIRSLEA